MADTQTTETSRERLTYFTLCAQVLAGADLAPEVRRGLDGLIMAVAGVVEQPAEGSEPYVVRRLRESWAELAAAMPAEWGDR